MASVTPLFEEHTSVGYIGDKDIHSEREKAEEFAKNMQEGVSAQEGVLAAYTAITNNLVDGRLVYIHYFRTKDKEARERGLMHAHEVHGKHNVKHSEVSRNLLGKVEEPRAKDDHSDFHKLSAVRLKDVFTGTAHVDWEAEPIGSHDAKFPAVRVHYIKYKEGISPDLIAAHRDLLTSLPTKFHKIKQVSFGKSTTHLYTESQLYPPTGVINWDLGVAYAYASTEDRAEVDSNPGYIKSRDWAQSLFKTYEIYDLSALSVK